MDGTLGDTVLQGSRRGKRPRIVRRVQPDKTRITRTVSAAANIMARREGTEAPRRRVASPISVRHRRHSHLNELQHPIRRSLSRRAHSTRVDESFNRMLVQRGACLIRGLYGDRSNRFVGLFSQGCFLNRPRDHLFTNVPRQWNEGWIVGTARTGLSEGSQRAEMRRGCLIRGKWRLR